MRINNVTHLGILKPESGLNLNINNEIVGFFGCELKTCSTIEEGLKSFEELEERNKDRRVKRSFEYK